MLKTGLTCLLIVLALTALALPARADSLWQRTADSRTSNSDNPDLEKYAFKLPVLGENGQLTFEELAGSGQALVLFFWLADCPLCHLQMPYVELLQQQVDEYGLNLRVVGINVDQRESVAEDYVAEKEPSFEMLFDGNARYTAEPFNLEELGCPLVYVFNADGEYVDYISGFKSNLSRTVLNLLDIELPEKE